MMLLTLLLQSAVVFSASAGTVTQSGLYTAPGRGAGPVRVVARLDSLADTVDVRVASASVASVDGATAMGGTSVRGAPGVLVGAWHVPPESLGRAGFPYSGGTINADARLLSGLQAIRRGGGRAAVSILRRKLLDPVTGQLTVAAATADVNSWPDIGSFIEDGTVQCVIVGDDIAWGESYGGEVPPLARWDSIARVVRVRWPEAHTCIRATPSQLADRRPWNWLTHYWAQFHARHDDILAWRDENLRIGKELGLCPVFGLNVLSGGNGESGLRSARSRSRQWQMSGGEIERYGRALLPYTPFLYGWRWEAEYDGRADIRGAWQAIRAIADTTRAAECRPQ